MNETCLNGDHNIFMFAPNDRDAHNPLLVHLMPSTMTWNERNTYKPKEMKMRRKEQRKEIQKQNKRKGYEDLKIELNAINATLGMVDLPVHRPGHGDQSECILLYIEDNTA